MITSQGLYAIFGTASLIAAGAVLGAVLFPIYRTKMIVACFIACAICLAVLAEIFGHDLRKADKAALISYVNACLLASASMLGVGGIAKLVSFALDRQGLISISQYGIKVGASIGIAGLIILLIVGRMT